MPNLSPNTCTSTCRGFLIYFSNKTLLSPNAFNASDFANLNNSKNEYDDKGKFAERGNVNHGILNNKLDTFLYHKDDTADFGYPSLDVNEFDVPFVKGLTIEDGAATLAEYTAEIIAFYFNKNSLYSSHKSDFKKILVCGGGRKNKFLIHSIEDYLKNKKNISLSSIDNYNLDGDYIESQAFGYLAIRSFLNLPISYPKTTRCKTPTVGGKLAKNF